MYRRISPLEPNALAVLAVIALAVSGLSALLGGPTTTSIQAQFPTPLLKGWGALIFLGGSIAATGLLWREPIRGLLIERAGYAPAIAAVGVYIYAAVTTLGFGAATAPVFITAGVGIGCAWRLWQIRKALRILRGTK